MSDAPDGPDELRGGKERWDPALEGATSSGRQGLGQSETGDEADDTSNTQLQGQEGGAASGGGT